MTTNEKARKIIYNQWQEFLEHNLDYAGISEAYKMAIHALDVVDAIDDIKAEINQICDDNGYQRIHKDDVFKIIDRHIGERSSE